MKLKHYILILIPVLSVVFYFLVFKLNGVTKSEFDFPNQANDKIINMFNTQIEQQINDHTQSDMHPGYIPESRRNTINYLKSIKSIESYARYGVTSKQARNYLELNITFNNGSVAEKVYTGYLCSGYLSPCLLMKVEMKDGNAVQVFTNGQEKKGSPDWIVNDLTLLIEKAISYDITRNRNDYFAPSKTQQDFDKEWEDQK